MRATVSHFEIPVRDLERAAHFYREVFGWTIQPLAWEGHPYARVRASVPAEGPGKEGIDGGLMESGDAGHPLLMIHVEGADLESVLARIVEAGGEIDLPVTRIGDMGLHARFRDPEGNLLGLWLGLRQKS
ncbi:MAG TPA: VOC family protein [Thermoanaerobaculia bacterium]